MPSSFDRSAPAGSSAITERLTTAVVVLICTGLVLYPVAVLLMLSFNVGDATAFPPQEWGLENYRGLVLRPQVILNTVYVALIATAMAMTFGFAMAWILTRTQIAGRGILQRMMELPYYLTPLVGALAWSILAGPGSGYLNQLWRALGGAGDLVNAHSPFGIAWVMALFEGSVAFVMISAVMASMDPSLEESSRTVGAGRWHTLRKITLPLVLPGVLGAFVFVFAEMLGAFAAPLVLGMPERYMMVTTSIWVATQAWPPEYGRAAALGVALFVVMAICLAFYRRVSRTRQYAVIGGKAFRPRPLDMGRLTWVLFGICAFYVFIAVLLPVMALVITSMQRLATAFLGDATYTLQHYRDAFEMPPIRSALSNSFVLGAIVATVGTVVMSLLVWIIYRSRLPGRALIEYVVMFPHAVPRMVFGLALLLAWLHMPLPLYGTLTLLGIAYFTVLLPLGVRTIAGVVMQMDKSLDECAQVCGASWGYRIRTISLPLLRPGMIAAWILLMMASVRELGASIFLMGPNSKVIGPAIIETWASSGSPLTAAMALIQITAVLIAVLVFFRLNRRRDLA